VWVTVVAAVDFPLATAMRRQMNANLQNFLDPLTGGDAGEGWLFGDPLRPSALLRVAQAVLDSAGDVQSVSVRIDSAGAGAEFCKDVPIRPHELVNLIHVDLVSKQRPAQNGGLR